MLRFGIKCATCKCLRSCTTSFSSRTPHYSHLSRVKLEENNHGKIITSNTKFTPHVESNRVEESEKDFLVRLKNNPDTFGGADVNEVVVTDDFEEEKFHPSERLSDKQYADIIKSLISKRQIKEALDVLEIRMIKEDKVKPNSYIYNLLLGACGRVGYTKKAFSLYNKMKQRGLHAMGGTYTALFNACANSPWPEDGLTRARHLRDIMIEKGYEPNETNFNAMIKAFGRCGDLETAFSLVDEMMTKKMPIKDDSINFLLQACIQDKEAGFRHALLVWRKITIKRIKPTFFTYNLMLRAIRDCGIGDVQVMTDVISKIVTNDRILLDKNNDQLRLESGDRGELSNTSDMDKRVNKHLESTGISVIINDLTTDDSTRPNLMAKVPHLGNIIALSEVKTAEERLLLVGGSKGFLCNMLEHGCTPDIKTFTQLLDCLPGNLAAEQELMKIMKKLNVKPDVDFFNMLIKKRSMRFDYENAKAVIEEMKAYSFRPNVLTYGVLSLGCKTKEEALELLNEMKQYSYTLNTQILGAMLHQACYHRNFSYVLEIMETTLRENVKPNKKFMECLETFKKKWKKQSNDRENDLSSNLSFQKGFRVFQLRYKTWLQEVEVDDEEDAHPWTQYRQTTDTDVRHYKDKSNRFKPRHASRFKVKTSLKHKK